MDYSQYVLSLIKIEKIRTGINPFIYYSLKYIYNPEFVKRSPCFSKALKYFFLEMSLVSKLNISDINSALQIDNCCPSNSEKQNITSIKCKENIDKLKDLFTHDIEWFITIMLKYNAEYILDSQEDFVLLHMIQSYIFDDNVPETSELMLGYNLFASSIELMFCLRLVLEFPIVFFHRKEEKHYNQYIKDITNRVLLFSIEWRKLFPKKYNKCTLIQQLMKNTANCIIYNTEHIDVNPLTLDEPLLTDKNINQIKLIREGIFLYEINEIAKQMCLIEHNLFSSITQTDIIQYIVNQEMPDGFNKFTQREKQFQSYILIFLAMNSNIENKKTLIQNYIFLAHLCKKMNNYQTCYMIISTFSKISIKRKTLLWRLVEEKYKDIYYALEREYYDLDLNEKTFFEQLPKEACMSIPHFNVIKNQINSYIIQIKNASEEKKVLITKEIRKFFLQVTMLQKTKYPFFVVNPLNDFLKEGFLEANKTKLWGIKSKFDFIAYSNPNADFDKLLNFLVKYYKKHL